MGKVIGLVAFVWATWNIAHTMSSGISGPTREYVVGRLIGLGIAVAIVLFVGVRVILLYVGAAQSLGKDSDPSY